MTKGYDDPTAKGIPEGDNECTKVRVSLIGMTPATFNDETLGEDKVSVVPEMPVTVSGVKILEASETMSPI